MKRFKFKLENVLKYRITLEGIAKNEYREALGLLNIEREDLIGLQDNQRQLMRFYDVKPGAVVKPEMLAFVARYSMQLTRLIEQKRMMVKDKEAVANEKFQDWNKKRKDVKVVERLKEKKWNEYRRETDKEDQIFQDDIFIAKKIREGTRP